MTDPNMPTRPPSVALDTNVLLDIYSCHDLFGTYERLGEQGVETAEATYRRARARESLLLAIALHRAATVTFSLGDESMKQMVERVPPDETDSYPTHHSVIMINFVCPVLLEGWAAVIELSDMPLSGNAADEALVDYAINHNVPLITNEGYGIGGVSPTKLRKKAKDRGVEVYTPKEYVAERKLDEDAAATSFIDSYRKNAPRYFRSAPHPKVMEDSMLYTLGYFRHVFFGEAEGQTERLAVSVSSPD